MTLAERFAARLAAVADKSGHRPALADALRRPGPPEALATQATRAVAALVPDAPGLRAAVLDALDVDHWRLDSAVNHPESYSMIPLSDWPAGTDPAAVWRYLTRRVPEMDSGGAPPWAGDPAALWGATVAFWRDGGTIVTADDVAHVYRAERAVRPDLRWFDDLAPFVGPRLPVELQDIAAAAAPNAAEHERDALAREAQHVLVRVRKALALVDEPPPGHVWRGDLVAREVAAGRRRRAAKGGRRPATSRAELSAALAGMQDWPDLQEFVRQLAAALWSDLVSGERYFTPIVVGAVGSARRLLQSGVEPLIKPLDEPPVAAPDAWYGKAPVVAARIARLVRAAQHPASERAWREIVRLGTKGTGDPFAEPLPGLVEWAATLGCRSAKDVAILRAFLCGLTGLEIPIIGCEGIGHAWLIAFSEYPGRGRRRAWSEITINRPLQPAFYHEIEGKGRAYTVARALEVVLKPHELPPPICGPNGKPRDADSPANVATQSLVVREMCEKAPEMAAHGSVWIPRDRMRELMDEARLRSSVSPEYLVRTWADNLVPAIVEVDRDRYALPYADAQRTIEAIGEWRGVVQSGRASRVSSRKKGK